MNEYFRMLKNPAGMSRLMVNYSRIKELEENGLSIEKIADIFNIDRIKLVNFIEIADAFVSAETTLSLDIGINKKEAFQEVAKALA